MSNYLTRFRAEPGNKLKLGRVDPNFHGRLANRHAAMPEIEKNLSKMYDLQYLLYAEKRHSLLIVLQGLDAGGKDGVIRHVITGMNPAACKVVAFKQPTAEELEHDFLWRIHAHVPRKGEVTIFNRSHYEDVLVVRVHKLVPEKVWKGRYELINEFERTLAVENNTSILKFFLYISKDEQLKRFKQRLDDPLRQWKISDADYKEREHWGDYLEAFEDAIRKTSTPWAPWFVIPANHKWFRNLAISQIIRRTLEKMHMKLPKPTVDLADIRQQYHDAANGRKS